MKATELLHNLGQSLWLDNITRDLLDDGTLNRHIGELGKTITTGVGDCEEVLAQFARAEIDIDALAAQLQDEGSKLSAKP